MDVARGNGALGELMAAQAAVADALDALHCAGALEWESDASDAFRRRLGELAARVRYAGQALHDAGWDVARLESRYHGPFVRHAPVLTGAA